MNTDITLYVPNSPCNQCFATKLHFKREGIRFNEVIADEATIDKFRDEGHASFPVVVAGDQKPWSGYRIDRIQQLAEVIRT